MLGCRLNWHEEYVKSMCFTGEDSGGRLTKSRAIGRRKRNGLVAYQPFGGVQRYANSRNVAHDGSDNF